MKSAHMLVSILIFAEVDNYVMETGKCNRGMIKHPLYGMCHHAAGVKY